MHDEMDRKTFEQLVELIDSGPPVWWWGIDRFVNLFEYVVHHEDVRRARDGWIVRPPPEVADVERLVWTSLRRSARMLARRVKSIALELRRPDGGVIRVLPEGPVVTVTGRPIELLLYLMGRRSVARVELDGPDEALAALAASDLRL